MENPGVSRKSQETRPHWGDGTLGCPWCFHYFGRTKNSSSSTSLLDGYDCELRIWGSGFCLHLKVQIYICKFICWKMFQHVFFRWSTSMLTEYFRSKWHLQRASQQSKTSGFTQLSLDIKPLPTTDVKLPTQGSLIEIPWHPVMVHTYLYTFELKKQTFV